MLITHTYLQIKLSKIIGTPIEMHMARTYRMLTAILLQINPNLQAEVQVMKSREDTK